MAEPLSCARGYRRAAVVRAGGCRQGDFPEDYDLWLRLHQSGHRMAKLPVVLLDWRDSPARLSRTDPRCSREAFDRLRARYLAREPLLLNGQRRNELVTGGRDARPANVVVCCWSRVLRSAPGSMWIPERSATGSTACRFAALTGSTGARGPLCWCM